MRITYIAAGAAGNYCGACAQDVSLVLGLRARGHEVELLPLYTPLRTDGPDPGADRVFYSGISTYLEQHVPLFRKAPRCFDWLLARPSVLKAASRLALSIRPEELGDMTVSVLRGSAGYQRRELEELLAFLERDSSPELVHLTNVLLSGLAPGVKSRLGVPVVCTLQGGETFIQNLHEPYAEEARALARRNVRAVDLFLAPSSAYAEEMADFLAVPRQRIRVVHPGIDATPYTRSSRRVRQPFRIGYLSRIAPEKGLDILGEAFHLLGQDGPDGAVLAIAGQMSGGGKQFWKEIRGRLKAQGLWHRVEYTGEVDFEQKVRFFHAASVFAQPSRVPERRGMAGLEALAAGVPIVVPNHGVFPDLVGMTGGGVLVPPEDPQALALALRALQDDPQRADRLGEAGARGVREHFSLEAAVTRVLEVYREVLVAGSAVNTEKESSISLSSEQPES